MLKKHFLFPFPLIPFSILLSALSLTACDIELENNVPGVPAEGLFASVVANQHSNVSEVQVAIAIFDNAEPINLLGGDVVQASTTNNSVLLLEKGFYTGSYAASLENTENFNQIDFLMVHKPLEAREGRWYPVDLLNLDPGPGEFVGASATITLPPELLNVVPSSSNFSSINDNFTLTWTAESASDTMQVRSAVSCTNGTKTTAYGTVAVLTDTSDDGNEIISLDQFIYDLNDGSSTIKFIKAEARAALQELLIKLSDGAADKDFFANLETINPIENSCEIQLFLFRQRSGSFDSSSTNGDIFGSRSADVTLYYTPN